MVNGNHNENVYNQIAKFPKINGQTSVATEASRYLLYMKKSNLSKTYFPFLISLFMFFLQFPTQKKLKTIKETYFGQEKINEENCSSIHKTYQNKLAELTIS